MTTTYTGIMPCHSSPLITALMALIIKMPTHVHYTRLYQLTERRIRQSGSQAQIVNITATITTTSTSEGE